MGYLQTELDSDGQFYNVFNRSNSLEMVLLIFKIGRGIHQK
jgi:hypothetical protein